MAISVGSPALNLNSSQALWAPAVGYKTGIDYNNPANATGTIDTVNAWFQAANAGNSCKIGTFTDGGSGSFTCNDAELIGEVVAGSAQQYTGLSIDIATGEYIGADARAAVTLVLERANSGGSGVYWIEGQYCDPSDSGTFALLSGDILSLNGTGTEGGQTYTESPKVIGGSLSQPALQQALTLTPKVSGAGPARLSLQQTLTLAPEARGQGLGRGVASQLLTLSPRVTSTTPSRSALQQALILSPVVQATAEATRIIYQIIIIAPQVEGTALIIAEVTTGAISPKAAVSSVVSASLRVTSVIAPRASATAEAQAELEQSLNLLRVAIATAIGTRSLSQSLTLAPKVTGRGQISGSLQQLLFLYTSALGTTKATASIQQALSLIRQALSTATSTPGIAQAITLNPQVQASLEEIVAIEQSLTLSREAKAQALSRALAGLALSVESIVEALGKTTPQLISQIAIQPKVVADAEEALALGLEATLSRQSVAVAEAEGSVSEEEEEAVEEQLSVVTNYVLGNNNGQNPSVYGNSGPILAMVSNNPVQNKDRSSIIGRKA